MFKAANVILDFDQWCRVFELKLARKQQRLTPQRRTIAIVLFEGEGRHYNVDELHRQVRERDASIGHATVFRTLKLLEAHEMVHNNKFSDGTRRYEVSLGGDEHHDHLICTACGRIVEFEDHDIERLQEEIAAKHGYQLTDHRLVLYGVCDKHPKEPRPAHR